MRPMNAPQLLTTSEAAKLLGVQAQTLRVWRLSGKGPSYVRLGSGRFARACYTHEAIASWITARTFTSTSDETTRRAAGTAA